MRSTMASAGFGTLNDSVGMFFGKAKREAKGARNLTRVSVFPYLRGAIWMSVWAWILSLAYVVFTPPSYTSKWSFILPAAATGTVVSLDTIGQSTTQPSQGFAGPNLSPKVIYKEIIESEPVREAAARLLDVKPTKFPKPRVKLIDETALILLEITGGSASESQLHAKALIEAFNQRIDDLRHDEMDKRAETVSSTLKSYQSNLRQARERILDSQRRSGVLSMAQYQDAATTLELARRKLADVSDELERQLAEQKVLVAKLGIEPHEVDVALKLASDPTFAKLASMYAEDNVAYQEVRTRLGTNHPLRVIAERKHQIEVSQIQDIARRLRIEEQGGFEKFLLLSNGPQRADLFKAILANDGMISGNQREIAALEARVADLDAKVKLMSVDASKLEDLNKEHLVAQAVYTSAVARLDTNRADIFASYPMVQVLSSPDLPEDRSQPRLLFAFIGGFFGTLLFFATWGLLWVRAITAQKRLKSA